jgi:hypothetical protein
MHMRYWRGTTLERLTRIALATALLVVFGVVSGIGPAQSAFAAPGAVFQIPGMIAPEDYKLGGGGVGYYDTTSGNSGRVYRNDDVDIQACGDSFRQGSCYNIAWIRPGEWLAYDINVSAAGSYVFDTRVATTNSNRTFHYEINGRNVTGSITVPNTGGMQTWATVSSPAVQLAAGRQELRIVFDGSSFNVSAISVRQQGTSTAAPQPSTNRTFYVSPSGNDAGAGTQGDPWRTLSSSMRKLKAGDTLLVRGGQYREKVEVRGESVPRGRPDARITVRAAPGENPVVKGFFWVSNTDYWTFDNIDVTWDEVNTNPQQHMVRLWKGTGWVWENSELYGARGYSALLVDGGATDWVVRRNYIHDTARANGSGQDHLIYVAEGSNGIVERNLLVNAPNGRGVKLGTSVTGKRLPTNVIVRYNTIVNSGSGNIGISNDANGNSVHRNILVRGGGAFSAVFSWNLTGGGNTTNHNVWFDSVSLLPAGTLIQDTGGNRQLDPMFNSQYKPTNAALYDAQGILQYGHLAGSTR